MPKGIKKLANILRTFVTWITLLAALIPILLQSSEIQNFIIQKVSTELSQKLNTKLTVGSIHYKLFNTVSLEDVYLQDQQKDSLLYVKEANADFDFWKIFKGKILFTGISFDGLHANLKVFKNGHNNFDFVIKAFQSKDKTKKSDIEYRIDKLTLKNSYLNFTKQTDKKALPANVIDINHLHLSDINTVIALNIFRGDTLNAEVRHLSFRERSGLTLKDLKTQVSLSKKNINIQFLEIMMPKSDIHITDMNFRYDSLPDLKNFAQKVKWNVPVNISNISPSDLSAFVPQFKGFKDNITLSGQISGRFSSLKFEKIDLKYGKALQLNADLELSGLPNLDETFVYAQINNLKTDKSNIQDVVSVLSKKPFILPKGFNQLGTISYKGNISGFFSNLVAYGNLSTNLGSISTDILLQFGHLLQDLKYNGTIKTSNFQLGRFLSSKALGKIAFNINTQGEKNLNKPIKGNLTAKVGELNFNHYKYQDIQLKGSYDGNGFDGAIELQDKNIAANFKGKIDLTKRLPFFDFDLKVADADLNALHLISAYPGATLSFTGKTNMIGNNLDNLNGFATFDSVRFTNQNKTLNLENIKFISRTTDSYTNFVIESEFVNGTFSGNFKYSTIGYTINRILQHYLPSLASKNGNSDKGQNHIDIDLSVENTKDITDVLNIPYELTGTSTLSGTIDEPTNKIDLQGLIPALKSEKQSIENVSLNIQNTQKQINLTTRAQFINKSGTTSMYLLAGAAQDSVTTQIGWQNASTITNAGEIQTVTKISNVNGHTAAQMKILPTQVIISDSIWDIRSSVVNLNPDSTIDIHNFKFENKTQFIHIDGRVSDQQKDGVHISMNDIDLDYVMNLIKVKGIGIGGIVTGEANILRAKKQPIFEADFKVKKVKLNDAPIGDAIVNSKWDDVNKEISLHGKFWNTNNDTIVVANGVYVPKKDSIDVNFLTKGFPIAFLNRYFSGIAENVGGYGYGKFRMYGPMKKIGFEGDPFIDKGQATIAMLRTSYFFNDTIHMTRNSIAFRNIQLFDEERNKGTLNGLIVHDGMFTDMKYRAEIKAKNMLALNTKSTDNDYFYGKAYATGTVNIFGDEKEANIQIKAVSQPNSKGYIQMGGASSASDNSFITFVDKSIIKRPVSESKQEPVKSNFNVKVDMQIDVTPEAEMELIVDPKAGDAITARGSGSLRIQFDTFSDIKLFGTYTIDYGKYLFTLQTVIRKDFSIDKGSTISWTGNPYNAKVNIRALYSLTASLSDLIDDVGSTTNRGSVPVNCVLKLTDDLMNPTIKFDIDLPSSDEGVKQKVKSIINTDEMMNRQIAYLLILNKFYIPEATTTTSTNTGIDNTLSFVSSTLSAHLNNWIQKALNNNNLSIGVDWQKSELNSDEIKAQLNYQNKRVILNSEFGYRNDNVNTSTTTNNNKFIGDFDLEYLITESGKLRGKVYSHTIDRSELKEAKSTQGLGIVYKEDFASVRDMINYYWRLITGKKKNDKNNETNK